VSASLVELRDLARGIYPAVLTGHGLGVALESLAGRAAVPVRLQVQLDGRPPEAVEVAAYYVVSEALTNIDKHAAASSAEVRVSQARGTLVIDVADDGSGSIETPTAGSGLYGLMDRVEALGGKLAVTAARTAGTRLHAEIPCA
jgi:signal transduction histidine kinase